VRWRADRRSGSDSRVEDVKSEVLEALARAQLPEDVRAGLDARPAGMEIEEIVVPPLLERGLSQSGVSDPSLLVRTLTLELTVKYLERDLERIEGQQLTEMRVIGIVAVLLAVAGGILKLAS
jgi:hypothetical protein